MRNPARVTLIIALLAASLYGQPNGKVNAKCHIVSAGVASQIEEFKETSRHSLAPSPRFMASCAISSDGQFEGEVLIWTSVDFIVAPATAEFAAKDNEQKARDVSWGQVAEMSDLRATTVSLKRNESRNFLLPAFDLRPVLAAFPLTLRDSDNLWPWMMALRVHVQDRDGRSLASTENLVALRPQPGRLRQLAKTDR